MLCLTRVSEQRRFTSRAELVLLPGEEYKPCPSLTSGGEGGAAGSEKALSASGQAGASRISRVSLGSLEASRGKPETEMCVQGVGAEGCHGLLGCTAALHIYDLSGKQSGKWTE